MGIETFYMTQSQNAQQGGRGSAMAGANGSMAASSAGSFTNGGLGFFDFFLQNAAAALETKPAKTAETNTTLQPQAGQSALVGTGILDMPLNEIEEDSQLAHLIQAMSSAEGVKEELAKIDNPTVADVIALNKQALEQGILPETQSDVDIEAQAEIEVAISEEEDEDSAQAPDILKGTFLIDDETNNRPALNNLARILKRLETLIENEDNGLIAANMTPQQMTDLKAKVEDILAGLNNTQTGQEATEDNAEDYAGFVLGLIRLLPPQSKNDFIATGKAVVIGDLSANSDARSIGTKDLTAQINGILTDQDGEDTSWHYNDLGEFDDFESFLDSMKSDKSGKASLGDLLMAKSGNDNANAARPGVALSGVLKNWPFGNSGSLFSAPDYSQDAMMQMGLSATAAHSASAASLTSVVTQSHAASLPHPGTQMVAANLQKLASNGETKNIRVQLDPPELGRVEIRMSFGKDKSVKAILTAEKPETYMMLQRDSHVLERALQDAGLDADGASLSFELAQDGQGFDQDGSHDGSRNQARGQGGASGEEEIIETTMTWQVDPQTGHMRYNILA